MYVKEKSGRKKNKQKDLAEFFQNKEGTNSEENLFQKQFTFTLPRNRDRDLDHQVDALNNKNFVEIDTKSKSNLSIME